MPELDSKDSSPKSLKDSAAVTVADTVSQPDSPEKCAENSESEGEICSIYGFTMMIESIPKPIELDDEPLPPVDLTVCAFQHL